ncbi:MAG: cytochrome c biogenesis CcdA family protein [Gemmatimonadota bacterium]
MPDLSVLVAFAAGLLSFLSPCVLPLWPSYVSFLTGMNADEIEGRSPRVRRLAVGHSAAFVLGFTLVFLALGASATLLGQVFRQYQEWIARVGGALIILFGLHVAGWLPIPILLRERQLRWTDKPVGFLGSWLVGLTFGAGWVPCIGPILGALLTLASVRSSLGEGVGLLCAYSAGLAIPFLLTAFGLGVFLDWLSRLRRYVRWVEWASGVLLIAVGALLVSGKFTLLAGWLANLTPRFLLERI